MAKSGKDNSNEAGLDALRAKIDGLDVEIQRLLNERAQVAIDVGTTKRAADPDGDVVYYRPEREAQLLRAVKERNEGPMSDEAMAKVFREVVSACLALERPLTVSFLGPAGTYSEAAASRHFGQAVRYEPASSILDVFRAVESGAADYGVVPVENSTEGAVNQTLDKLIKSPLLICGEATIDIHHHLLTSPKNKGKPIERVYSHPQALAQCRRWLGQNWPGVETLEVASTAEGARIASEEVGAAAIAGDLAADRYDMAKLARRIEDQTHNRTRFLVLGKDAVPESGIDKTSLLLTVHHEPGSLHQVLEPFREASVNMARIESRPSPDDANWSYVFFIDFIGHRDTPEIAALLSKIQKVAASAKVLGSYPQAVLEEG